MKNMQGKEDTEEPKISIIEMATDLKAIQDDPWTTEIANIGELIKKFEVKLGKITNHKNNIGFFQKYSYRFFETWENYFNAHITYLKNLLKVRDSLNAKNPKDTIDLPGTQDSADKSTNKEQKGYDDLLLDLKRAESENHELKKKITAAKDQEKPWQTLCELKVNNFASSWNVSHTQYKALQAEPKLLQVVKNHPKSHGSLYNSRSIYKDLLEENTPLIKDQDNSKKRTIDIQKENEALYEAIKTNTEIAWKLQASLKDLSEEKEIVENSEIKKAVDSIKKMDLDSVRNRITRPTKYSKYFTKEARVNLAGTVEEPSLEELEKVNNDLEIQKMCLIKMSSAYTEILERTENQSKDFKLWYESTYKTAVELKLICVNLLKPQAAGKKVKSFMEEAQKMQIIRVSFADRKHTRSNDEKYVDAELDRAAENKKLQFLIQNMARNKRYRNILRKKIRGKDTTWIKRYLSPAKKPGNKTITFLTFKDRFKDYDIVIKDKERKVVCLLNKHSLKYEFSLEKKPDTENLSIWKNKRIYRNLKQIDRSDSEILRNGANLLEGTYLHGEGLVILSQRLTELYLALENPEERLDRQYRVVKAALKKTAKTKDLSELIQMAHDQEHKKILQQGIRGINTIWIEEYLAREEGDKEYYNIDFDLKNKRQVICNTRLTSNESYKQYRYIFDLEKTDEEDSHKDWYVLEEINDSKWIISKHYVYQKDSDKEKLDGKYRWAQQSLALGTLKIEESGGSDEEKYAKRRWLGGTERGLIVRVIALKKLYRLLETPQQTCERELDKAAQTKDLSSLERMASNPLYTEILLNAITKTKWTQCYLQPMKTNLRHYTHKKHTVNIKHQEETKQIQIFCEIPKQHFKYVFKLNKLEDLGNYSWNVDVWHFSGPSTYGKDTSYYWMLENKSQSNNKEYSPRATYVNVNKNKYDAYRWIGGQGRGLIYWSRKLVKLYQQLQNTKKKPLLWKRGPKLPSSSSNPLQAPKGKNAAFFQPAPKKQGISTHCQIKQEQFKHIALA